MKDKPLLQEEHPVSGAGRQVSRRDFLKVSGSGVFIFFTAGPMGTALLQQRGRTYPRDFNAYLSIGDDGRVALYCSKIEMGQGIITSMAQMLAEELDVGLESIDMVMGDTRLCPWDGGTTGSRSTKFYGPPLRKAGAEARAILMQLASERLQVPVERLLVKNAWISDSMDHASKVSYADLVRGKQIDRHLPDVPIKTIAEHSISGRPTRRTDARKKVSGEAKFTSDILLPDMLYAKVLRPPAHGATLASVDVSGARKVVGTMLVREDDLIAVLHEKPELAEEALASVSATWELPEAKVDHGSVFDHLKNAAQEGRIHVEKGNPEEGRAGSKLKVKSEFHTHYIAHSPIEPYSVLAHVQNEQVTVWASTQAPFRVQRTVADTLDIPEDRVHVITPFVGGGFGGKKSGQQISEAVRLSKVSGRPVQLAWSRAEEFFYDAFRPAAVVQMESGLNEDGRISFWDCDLLFPGTRSSEPIYDIPHFSVKTTGGGNVHPFSTGAWRGPGSNTNVFAMESHTDMLALAAGMDPLSFRLKNLSDKRMIRVLRAAADSFGKDFQKGPSGKGYGISCTNYLNTYVATIATVSVDRSSGVVRVEHVVCAQDMGEIINPMGAKMQIEGGITMGLSAALFEEIDFSGGDIRTKNFDAYRITRFSDAPDIEVVLIHNPDLAPQGCGEPAITTIGAALANGIFDAVGARLTTLPMTPERILAAME